jgi:tryptophan synthase alpha chain
MSRIQSLFDRKKQHVLNVYVTAGYPELGSTLVVMKALQEAGVDLIELGMPYSDPLADGPVIQASGARAIHNGMTIPVLFRQLKEMRSDIRVPVVLMGYMNPVMQYGFERFCQDAAAVGVDGLILPDLPEYEFEQVYGPVMKKYGLDFIFLVTPETSEERVRHLDRLSTGFLYAVSSSSTTGKDQDMHAIAGYLRRLQGYGLKNPILVGFGIKDRESFQRACAYASGAIIGTAFIRSLEQAQDLTAATHTFIKQVLS